MAYVRTFVGIQKEVLAWLDEAGDQAVTQLLVKQAIRAAHEKRLTDERWSFMLSRPTNLDTIVGEQNYALHSEFLRLMYVKNLATGRMMTEFTDQSMIAAGYDWSVDTDSASKYMLVGHREVQRNPNPASVLAVASTNSGDNNVASVTIRGDTSLGVQTETIKAGATGTVVFADIWKVTKSGDWVGDMTLTGNSGATDILSLPSCVYGKSYQLLYLLASPDTVETMEYRFYRQPSPLVADNDRPDYPTPFEELLVWDALLDLAAYNVYSPDMIGYWTNKRNALLLTMQQTLGEANSINQAAVYTSYTPR